MKFIRRQLKRLGYALYGIHYAIRKDRSFRLQWYGLGSIVLIVVALLQPLTSIEFLFIAHAYMLILITELQNSALEYALDHLHPETHDSIGRSKDMAAGAVLIAGIFLTIVIATVIFNHYL